MSIPAILNPQPSSSGDASNLALLADAAVSRQHRDAEYNNAETSAETSAENRSVERLLQTAISYDAISGNSTSASSSSAVTVVNSNSVMTGKLIFVHISNSMTGQRTSA